MTGDGMNCERCGRREAAVKYIEVEEGVKRVRWLCEPCAAEEGAQVPDGADGADAFDGLDVPVFLDMEAAGHDDDPADDLPACPACGTRFSSLQGQGLLGCPACYEHFREPLTQILRRFHRAATHVGKAPRARGARAERRLRVAQLRGRLDAAVTAEDFEAAALLRDEIATLQSGADQDPPSAGEDA